jgi:hypothetical protein
MKKILNSKSEILSKFKMHKNFNCQSSKFKCFDIWILKFIFFKI